MNVIWPIAKNLLEKTSDEESSAWRNNDQYGCVVQEHCAQTHEVKQKLANKRQYSYLLTFL